VRAEPPWANAFESGRVSSVSRARFGAVGLLLVLALVLRLGYVAVTPGYGVVDDARDHDIHARSIDASHALRTSARALPEGQPGRPATSI
jgi:hypothetical protein